MRDFNKVRAYMGKEILDSQQEDDEKELLFNRNLKK